MKRDNSGTFKVKDRTGQRYGSFVVQYDTGKKDASGSHIWLATCDCEKWKEKYSEMVGRKPLPNNQAHVNILYGHYERCAKDRNIKFNLNKEEFRTLIEQNCYYCGAEPTVTYTAKSIAGEYAWNGVDRVDNSKGYEMSNCVPCCTMCNISKSNHTKEKFLDWVKRVYEHSIRG